MLLDFKKWVTSIQTAVYNGASTKQLLQNSVTSKEIVIKPKLSFTVKTNLMIHHKQFSLVVYSNRAR